MGDIATKTSPDASDPRIDRAWWILLGAGLCMFCGQPAVILFTFGVFAPEIIAATGWSPALIAAAIAPGTILAALLSPLVGAMADRFGVRAVAIAGGPAYALGFLLLGLLPQSGPGFVLLMALTCALGFAATPVLYAQLVTGWFARRRGVALSIAFGCSSLGVAFWSTYAATLLTSGWRFAYPAMGVTAGVGVLIAALLLIRNAPRATPRGEAPAAAGLTMREASRTPIFWKIVAIFMLLTGALGGASVNLPVMLRHGGFGAQEAASIMVVVGIAMFAGRLSVGFLLDRYYSPYVTAGFSVLPIAGFALLLVDHGTGAFIFAAAAIGAGLGSELNAAAYIASRAFGLRAFGGIYGAITLAYGLASAAGPALIGAALAKDAALEAVFVGAIALLVPAILLLLTIRPHSLPYGPPPAKPAP